MAFTRGQTDRFGRPIPSSPGYQVLINDDGSEVQQRNRLILPASMVASDSDDNDASTVALTVAPGDLTAIAAHTVLGNNTGSSAAPAAVTATAIGFGVLAAATQAALTALIALSTNALAGLMSAAQFLKLDAAYDVVYSAAYAAATSVPVTWTAGTYRRIEVFSKNSSGATTSIKITLTGADAGGYFFGGLTSGGTPVSGAAQNDWNFDVSGGGGSKASLEANIQVLGYKTMTGTSVEDTGASRFINGVCTDSTHPITGLVVTFSTACDGWLEVIGYK